MVETIPKAIVFAQHGWADFSSAIASLAQSLVKSDTPIISPDLGWGNTWLRMEPLVAKVEEIAQATITKYPQIPLRIIGHSMGGLIWLEILHQHPEWWGKIESLVLIASPVGGSDLARIIDPFGVGIGIARDLGINRREMAEAIAKVIPTLIIAGDSDRGSDGTITVQSTKFLKAKFISLPGLRHEAMKNHPTVAATIRDFWNHTLNAEVLVFESELVADIVQRLQAVTGITDAHRRDCDRAQEYIKFQNGISIRTWRNLFGVDHVFVTDSQGECLYGGFVGWMHAQNLQQALAEIKKVYGEDLQV